MRRSGGEEFPEVKGSVSVKAFVSEEGDLELNSEWDWEPVE